MKRIAITATLFVFALSVKADDETASWKHTVLRNGQPAVGAKAMFVELSTSAGNNVSAGTTAWALVDAIGVAQVARAKNSTARFTRVLVRDAEGHCGYGTVFSTGGLHPNTIDLKDTTTLLGRITDVAGKPIPDLKLKAVALGPETFARFGGRPMAYVDTPDAFWEGIPVQINVDGSFRVPGVMVQHSVAVQFTAPSAGTGRFWIEPGKPAVIQLDQTGTIRLDFTVPPGAKPLPQSVIAKRKSNVTNGYLEATAAGSSTEGGPITITGIPAGTYQFTLPFPGPNDHYASSIAPIDVKPGTTVNATSVYQPAARITANFIDNKTNKAVAGGVLNIIAVDADRYDLPLTEATADAGGRLDFRVPAGLTSVAPKPIDGYAVVKFSRNQFREYATDPIPIAAGALHNFGQFALAPTLDVSGTVVDEAGEPVAGAHIMIGFSSNFYRGPKILSSMDGRFVIRGMNPDGGLFGVIAAKGEQLTTAPVAVDPAAIAGDLRLVVSKKFSAYVRARAVDRKGQPIAGTTIELSDSYRHLSSTNGMVGGGTAGKVGETNADGLYQSGALQAGNKTYGVTFSAPGYRTATTISWEAKPGETHNFGNVVLTRTNSVAKGIVTDRAAKPISGATVFSNADGPRATKTTTNGEGQFSLGGLFEGPAIVSAKADGFVLASRPVEADGEPVTFTLRRSTDAPDPPPTVSEEYRAASEKLARHLVEAMWANRIAAKDDGATTLRAMARIDLNQARHWRDEELARSQTDLTKELDVVDRERNLEAVARRDPDEAVAMLNRVVGIEGLRAVCALCDKLCVDTPDAAQRLAEEAVARARGVSGEDHGWALAQAGEMVYRAGRRDAGRKIIEEAAANAEELAASDLAGYRRGMIAARLAYFDPARTRRLVDPITNANEFNRWLGASCVRLAAIDLPLAKQWLRELRPGNGFDQQRTRQHIAYHLAKTNPDEAILMIESIEDRTCRAIGYADLAWRLTDRTRGIQLIDRAVDQIVEDSIGYFNNNGNSGGTAAILLYYGKKVGHPDLAGLRDRVLAARSTPSDHPFREQLDRNVMVAKALALTDPDTARLILAKALPPDMRIKVDLPHLSDVLVAVALTDPAAATHLVDHALADAVRTQRGYNRFDLSGLARMLTHTNGKFGEVGRSFVGFFEEE